MATMSMRKTHRSLSPVSNGTSRKKSRLSEPYVKALNDDLANESIAWNVTNKEISEWQKMCQIGRPNWRSSAPKWTQGRDHSSWQEEIHAIPQYVHLDRFNQPKPSYDEQRRAVTDSYLADSNKVQELAQLVAVQLLGACFTIWPEYIPNDTGPTYQYTDNYSSSEIPRSLLISALRMHTEARHSPCFGYQARNTSPVYHWHGAYDGASPRSHGSSSDQHFLKANVSRKLCRKKRVQCTTYLTEDPDISRLIDTDVESEDTHNIHSTTTTNTKRRLNSEVNADQEPKSSITDKISKSYPSTPREINSWSLHSSLSATEVYGGERPHAWTTYRYSRVPNKQNRKTLQSVIRSEPHHIYIQPVRELVVKRWRKLRHHFGNGFGEYGPFRRVTNAIPSIPASSISTPAEGSIGDPVSSGDRSERRHRVRKRGDMSSMDSSPQFNTAVSATGNEIAIVECLQNSSLRIASIKTAGAAEAIASAFADPVLTRAVAPYFTEPDLPASFLGPGPSAAIIESLPSRTDFSSPIGSAASNSKASNSPSPSSPRHRGQRRHRKSNLSEICTPEEIEESSILSRLASPLMSPKEDSSLAAVEEFFCHISGLQIEHHRTLSDRVSQVSNGFSQDQDEKPGLVQPGNRRRRPSIVRTSTTGTQMFTPDEDGIDLNGLPTGKTWEEQGFGSERKERSFL